MALVWCDGFEGYGDTDNVAPLPTNVMAQKYRYANLENQMRLYTTNAVDNRWLRVNIGSYNFVLTTQDYVAGGTCIAGIAFSQWDRAGGGFAGAQEWPLFMFRNTVPQSCGEVRVSQGTLYVVDAAGQYIGGCKYMSQEQEYAFIEAKCVSDPTAGEITVRVNGAVVFTTNTANTQGAGGVVTRVSIGETGDCIAAKYSGLDSFYVCDGTGNTNNDFLGPCSVKILWPASDDTTQFATIGTTWVTHYQQVDYPKTGTTNYVQDATSGNRDKFTIDNTPNFGTIFGTVLWARAKYVSSAATYRLLADSNGTESESANITCCSSYKYNSFVLETDPDTGNAWTNATVNALKTGFEVQ